MSVHRVVFFFVALLVLPGFPGVEAGDQTVSVKAKLVCEGKPASGVKVELIEEDSGNFLDPDDRIAEVKSDGNGEVAVKGTADEKSQIEPVIRIHHSCSSKDIQCVRLVIPADFITNGKEAKLVKDFGQIELKGKNDKDCKDRRTTDGTKRHK